MVKGTYCDLVVDKHGRVQWSSGWHSNAIVQTCDLLIAALLKKHDDFSGISYWAVGQGEAAWDGDAPGPSINTSRLVNELIRIPPTRMEYLVGDPKNEGEYKVTRRPSRILEVEAVFNGETLVSNSAACSLREFGLFGGNASERRNSGCLIDYVIHPRIDLTADNTLTRRLRLTFNSCATIPPATKPVVAPTTLGANLSVQTIDGIDSHYTAALNKQSIKTINDLAEMAPSAAVPNISQGKLQELRAKARILLRCQSQLPSINLYSFGDQSLNTILITPCRTLASKAKVPVEIIESLQETLNELKVALDEVALDTIRIKDLLKK